MKFRNPFRKPTRHELAQAAIERAKRAIMWSRLQAPAPLVALPAEKPVRRIEVQAGNLGTLNHYAIKVPVRIVRRVQIEVR